MLRLPANKPFSCHCATAFWARPVAAAFSFPSAAGTPRGAAPPRRTPGSAAPRSERAAGQPPPGCSGRRRGTAHGVRLGRLRVRGAGGLRGHHRLRQGRQRPVPRCRPSVRWPGRAGCLPAVQRAEERVAFSCGIWNLVCCHGDEILQLQKSNAWGHCWCQFTDGWKTRIEDDGKAT